MIGYIGLVILVIAYLSLLTKYKYYFIRIDILASFILTVYAITKSDIPFILVNGIITIILIVKHFKNKKDEKKNYIQDRKEEI